ncbi:hypothetical protein AAVH_07181 [Aphelenchoides avenae]|nr:hypothetical protein AAVH_07181 [Aphelenchus avenae]
MPYVLSSGAALATLVWIIVSTVQALARASTVEWTLALLLCFANIVFLVQCYFIYVKFDRIMWFILTKAFATTQRECFRFGGSLPRHDYIQRLIERIRQSSSPERMRHVLFTTSKVRCESVSASFHLPGAYVEFFPCPHCTPKDEEGRTSLVEVFHFPNVHEPSFCATVTFAMPADYLRLLRRAERGVEVEFTRGCPNAPTSEDHSPRVVLPIITDVCIEVLLFLPRCKLEKMLLASRRWSNVIEWAACSLRQRRRFSMLVTFFGESSGMLSVRFIQKQRHEWRILRVLIARGPSQALDVVRSHLQNAYVGGVLAGFVKRVLPPGPPHEMLFDIPLPRRFDWLRSLMHTMPPSSEIDQWEVRDKSAGFNNLPALARCALEAHRTLGRVQELVLSLLDDDATGAQLTSLLNEPSIRGFNRIVVDIQRVVIETSELRVILSSWQSLQLSVTVSSDSESQGTLLALPAQLIQDFVALSDANGFAAQFWLTVREPKDFAFPDDLHEATGRRKRFRYVRDNPRSQSPFFLSPQMV